MSARILLLNDFLALNKLNDYAIEYLPFDASYRRYIRLVKDKHSLIVQDSPPEYYSLTPHLNISQYLLQNGLTVPKIYNYDIEHGFMLIEDFGNIHYKQIIEANITQEQLVTTFQKLIDVIIKLQQLSLPAFALPKQTPELLIAQASIYFNNLQTSDAIITEFKTIVNDIFSQLKFDPTYFVHRDYHVENLMYLQNKKGHTSVGIIDFQDALVGSPIYDLVSLLQDVRTSIANKLEQNMLNYYLQQNLNMDKENFSASYAILGFLRNLRIAAIFKSKIYRDKQTKYLQFLPQVQYYIQYNLQHPKLNKLKKFMLSLGEKYN